MKTSKTLLLFAMLIESAATSVPVAFAQSQATMPLPESTEELEAITPRDPRFVPAAVELEKKYYQTQDWQKFFGYAVYYRSQMLKTDADLKKNFNGLLLSLEVLALVKHCRWDHAAKLTHEALAAAKKVRPEEVPELQKLVEHLQLQAQFPTAYSGTAKTTRPSPLSNDLLWSIDTRKLAYLSHPSQIRVIVPSECEKYQ